MSATKITDRIYSVGVLNPSMRIFDIVMKTEYGTSYNSFIVKGDNKTALIETCHMTFFEQYLKNIKEVCNPKDIDYIILNHCEPDHTGVLNELAKLCPNAEILLSRAGSFYIKNITNNPSLPTRVVKDGVSIDLGGLWLKFIDAPFLHWPDSMFTWCEEEKALFSCDFLGAHFCEPYVFDFNMAYKHKYVTAFKEYYDAIFSPFSSYVQKGLDKIKGLDIDFACTSHGPILTKDHFLPEAILKYSEWSKPKEDEQIKIPIFHCSAYGNTSALAKEIELGILSVLPNANVEMLDLNEHSMPYLQSALGSCNAFCIGSPTINADAVPPIWELLSSVDAINSRQKPALVFGSYGWSGEALPNIMARLQGLRMKVFETAIKAQFVPSEQELKDARENAILFAKELKLN